jgi:hypothetical protein
VAFDSSKFLTDVMNDNTDKGSGAETKKPGDWKEGTGGGGPGGAKNKGGSGKKPGEPGYDSEPVGQALTFSDGKESHRLWFAEKSGDATLMVASDEEKVPERLKELKGKVKNLLEADRDKADTLIKKAEALLPDIKDTGKQVAVMKQAEANAKKTYEEHGKKKGKKTKPKASRKDKNKELKSKQKKLEAVLTELFVLMRMEPWELVDKPAKWEAQLRGAAVPGEEAVRIVGGGKTARLRLDKSPWKAALNKIKSGPIKTAKNESGMNAIATAEQKIQKAGEEVEKVPLAGAEVQVRAKPVLKKIADGVVPAVAKLGKTLKLKKHLAVAAMPASPKNPAWPVMFGVRTTKAKKYKETFDKEMRKQLTAWEQGFAKMTVDTWVVHLDTFKIKSIDELKKLDRNARAAVAKEIEARLAAAEPLLGEETELLKVARLNLLEFIKRENLEKFVAAKDDESKLTKEQMKNLYPLLQQLRRRRTKVEEAEKIAPASAKLRRMAPDDPKFANLSEGQERKLSKLTREAKISGRSDQEEIFRRLHAKGIRMAAAEQKREKLWRGLTTKGKELHVLIHNPDQVAGGYGDIADITPVKQPRKPVNPTRATLQQYEEDVGPARAAHATAGTVVPRRPGAAQQEAGA